MVLNDLVIEYQSLCDELKYIGPFFEIAEEIKNEYELTTKTSIKKYYLSTVSNPLGALGADLNTSINKIYHYVLKLNSVSGRVFGFFHKIEKLNISNDVLDTQRDFLIKSLEQVLNDMYRVIEKQYEESKKEGYLHEFLKDLYDCLDIYHSIMVMVEHIMKIETLLYEPLPDGVLEEQVSSLELKSERNSLDFKDFTDDLYKLSKFLTQFEQIKSNDTHPIFVRRIESGSLRIVWGSKEIELSAVSDVINTIVNAIKQMAYLPSEIRMRHLEEEERRIEIQKKEVELKTNQLVLINSVMDTLIDKVGLDKEIPEDKEKIQLLCVPLIDYLESNPVGSVNGIGYDITKELFYLEDKKTSIKKK